MNRIYFIIFASITVMISGCVKEPIKPLPPVNLPVNRGLLVLNEGLFQMNNSTLTYFDFEKQEALTDYFELKNARKMGDTGNDMGLYGNKIYIVLTGSNVVEVISLSTGISLGKIPFIRNGVGMQPRNIAFASGRAFVCSFDGTVAVIDTSSLTIERLIAVGRNPDGMAVAGNKIYVSNSGGLSYPNYDNTVSVIDVFTFQEIKRIKVVINPFYIDSDSQGNIYVISRGNYGSIKSCLQVIDGATNDLVYTFSGFELLNFHICRDTAYVINLNHSGSGGSSVMTIDLKTRQVITSQFITDGSSVETVFGILCNPSSGDVFITDAKGFVNQGYVNCYDRHGNRKYAFKAGLNPRKMLILKN